ncbi:hypothetical protein G6F57_016319 [Rhizopus arrhizus]|nr:hypothetical protein G6F57_016319 [Rhizopus arrhizus]
MSVTLAGQDRIVVGTVDGDRDFLRRDAAVAVVDRHGELLGQRFTHAQRLHGRVAVGQVIGPVAVGVDRQCAVLASAVVVDRPGVRVGRVDIRHVQLAGDGQRGVFGHGAGSLAAQRRNVIGALDGDNHGAGRTVRRRHGEGLGQGFTDSPRLHAAVVVVQVVDPRAAGVDRECAMLAGLAGLHDEAGFTIIHVGDVELAVCGEGGVFLDSALVVVRAGRGDERRIVHADDRHFNGGRGRRAAGIGDGVGNRGGRGLAFRQMLEARARREDIAAVRKHRERAAVRAGNGYASRRHRAAAHRNDGQRIAVGIRVVGQQVAAEGGVLIATAGAAQRRRGAPKARGTESSPRPGVGWGRGRGGGG